MQFSSYQGERPCPDLIKTFEPQAKPLQVSHVFVLYDLSKDGQDSHFLME